MPSLSYRFGDLRDTPVEHLTLGNPRVDAAVHRPGGRNLFLPASGHGAQPPARSGSQAGSSARTTTVDRSTKKRRNTAMVRARPGSLNSGQTRFSPRRFRQPRSTPNSKYDDPPVGVDLENDSAVVLGDVVLAVEAKSHRVSAAAGAARPMACESRSKSWCWRRQRRVSVLRELLAPGTKGRGPFGAREAASS